MAVTAETTGLVVEPLHAAERAERRRFAWRAALAAAAEVALIFAIFAIHGGWPIPEVNEPHYLGKARHFWDPSWASRDFFLQTADAHQVFYYSLGWLTLWLPLPATALVGRVLTWIAMACTWRVLCRTLVSTWGFAAAAAAVFVALNERAHMAGEWVVGGFEAKGLAYALVFASMAAVVAARWNLAWILAGAASAFHVLVGGWTTLTAAFAWLTVREGRTPVWRMLPGLIAGVCLAMAGLWPAIVLTIGVPSETAAEATHVYVYERLPHHLVAQSFPLDFIVRFSLLCVVWILLCIRSSADAREARFRAMIFGAMLIMTAGIFLGLLVESQPRLAESLLRYYWFRLSDAFVPLGVAILSLRRIEQLRPTRPVMARLCLMPLLAYGAFHMGDYGAKRVWPEPPRADKPGRVLNYADWRDACSWIKSNTPRDALWLTPRACQTFKWYTGRGEVATLKDIPQDAAGIVEWRRRLASIYGADESGRPVYDSVAERGADAVRRLGDDYGFKYVLVESSPALDAEPATHAAGRLRQLYRNGSYAVYVIEP